MQPDAFDNPRSGGVYVSSEREHLDLTWVITAIEATYWGKHRTARQITESIGNSLCFGLFERVVRDGGDFTTRDRQIGFARVITDYATFSELVDVVIDPEYRKRRLGTFLVQTAINDPRISKTVINLGTRDAHKFYEALGFNRVEKMKRIPA